MFKPSTMSYGSECGWKTPEGIARCMAGFPFRSSVDRSSWEYMDLFTGGEWVLARRTLVGVWHLLAGSGSHLISSGEAAWVSGWALTMSPGATAGSQVPPHGRRSQGSRSALLHRRAQRALQVPSSYVLSAPHLPHPTPISA